jgi:hypothetical protein
VFVHQEKPSGAPFRLTPLAPGITLKLLTQRKWLSSGKHSSLLCCNISDEKSFKTLTSGVNIINLVFFVTDDLTK